MPSFNPYKYVFQPIKVGNVTLKNRLQFSPMVCSCTTVDGQVSPEFVDFVSMQARTGVGLITIGSTPLDHEAGAMFFGELDVTQDKNIIDLLRVSETAHRYGAKISAELSHGGRAANTQMTVKPPLAPSYIPVDGGPREVKEMTYQDIDDIIQKHADIAARLVEAEFDMVMIHAAHGCLIGQFLSPLTNHRTDCYGGSPENRRRLLIEILKAVRERVGNKLAIDMRISGDEIIEGGMRIEDTIEIIKDAQKYIDAVHVSAGILCEPSVNYYTMPPFFHPHCHNVKYSEAVKNCPDVRIPVTVVGSITSIAEAEEIIASGKADMVAMARQLMADPDTIHNAWRGEDEKTRPCMRCFECTAKLRHIRCAINPALGREGQYREIPLARKKKKVVVIGGGVAGMMATKTLVARGHDVVLFEKGERLGMRLYNISCLSCKSDMRRYHDWDVRSTMECGADIRLNTEATPELVMAENPDAIFVAVGSNRLNLPIPGHDGNNVKHVLDVDSGRESTGQRVVICGGGLSGTESALQLAQEGKNVTVVDMIPLEAFAADMPGYPRAMLLDLLKQNNVKLVGCSKVLSFSDEGVQIEDRSWKQTMLPADTIVTAFGMVKDDSFVERFRELIPEVYVIGDCAEVKNIKGANTTAFNYAVEC